MIFRHAILHELMNTTFDGHNRGIIIYENSVANITDSTFKNLVQNVKEGSVYIPTITEYGSAIGIISSILSYKYRYNRF